MSEVATTSLAEQVAAEVLELPQAECPVTHYYGRMIEIPPGAFIVGKKHRFPCLNILLSGKMRLLVEGGEPQDVEAPMVFETGGGSQKMAYVFETVRFLTLHPDAFEPADISKVEDKLFEPSPALLEHEQRLRLSIEQEVALLKE